MHTVTAGEASIPTLGLGTWQNTGEQCTDSVQTALELGYRHVDTAQAYRNEEAVGRGIQESSVDREDVFLTTKVWRSNLRDGDLQSSIHESLERLDVAYLDLLLLHWPHPRVDAAESLRAAADLQDDGHVRHVGVSNYPRRQLDRARERVDVPVVADQVLYNPYKRQDELLEYCQTNEIALQAYSPLARGGVLDDATLAEIGERYDKAAAQVALRWLVQQEQVVAIPKATSREHIEANAAIFDFELSDDEMTRVRDASPGLRTRLYNMGPPLMRMNPF